MTRSEGPDFDKNNISIGSNNSNAGNSVNTVTQEGFQFLAVNLRPPAAVEEDKCSAGQFVLRHFPL